MKNQSIMLFQNSFLSTVCPYSGINMSYEDEYQKYLVSVISGTVM
jgi:hypothetical protein